MNFLWGRGPDNPNTLFRFPLENTSRMQRSQTLLLHPLSTGKNLVAHIN